MKEQTLTEYKQCGHCGLKHDRKSFKAYGVECYKCGKRNHYARMCHKGKRKDQPENKNNRSSKQEVNEEIASDNFNLLVNTSGMWSSNQTKNPQKVIVTQQMRILEELYNI